MPISPSLSIARFTSSKLSAENLGFSSFTSVFPKISAALSTDTWQEESGRIFPFETATNAYRVQRALGFVKPRAKPFAFENRPVRVSQIVGKAQLRYIQTGVEYILARTSLVSRHMQSQRTLSGVSVKHIGNVCRIFHLSCPFISIGRGFRTL